MGGNALKKTFTRRYERDEYDEIEKEVSDKLRYYFKQVGVPEFFENKESFGDLDILVSTDDFDYDGGIRNFIEEVFFPDEIHHNANVWSFNYREFQIDLITCSDAGFKANLNYLSWNDCGNLMGKLAHAMGIKYGQSGLFYRHKYEGQKIGDIPITTDMEDICHVLDLDYDVWKAGFTELEDIFKFITKSKAFDWKRVQFDQLDRVNRERDKKRATYAAFIEWIDEHVADDDHTFDDIDKTITIKWVDKLYPDAYLIMNIRKLDYEHCKKLYIQSKFNGSMAIRACGFEGKELGQKLSEFRDFIEDHHNDYDKFILNHTTEEIIKTFVSVSCRKD